MKKTTLFLLFGLPLASFAQQPPGFSQDQMAKMMQQAEKMQSCMSQIDKAAMQAYEKRAEKMGDEMKALCAAGKRDAAMEKAMEFGKDIASDPALAQMRKCGEGMRQAMPGLMPEASHSQGDAAGNRHPCDNFND